MDCPKCNKPMRKIRWEVTNNFKVGADFKEYDKNSYACMTDDVWISVETPLEAPQESKDTK